MQPRHQLAALIQSVEDANGWSDPEVAERARQRGHTISKSNISRLRLEPVRSIKGDAIKALAAGLGISPLDIADAALASMGIHRTSAADNDVETAIRRDPLLADSQRRMLLALLREMKGTHYEDSSTQSTPGDPATDDEAGTDGTPMNDGLGTKADYELAANRTVPGPSMGERLHRQVEAAGEESQDHDYDDPA